MCATVSMAVRMVSTAICLLHALHLLYLCRRKRVFSEPRGAGAVEGVLSEYAAAIAGCSTAQAASKTGAGASCSGAQPGASGTPGAQAWCGSSSGSLVMQPGAAYLASTSSTAA